MLGLMPYTPTQTMSRHPKSAPLGTGRIPVKPIDLANRLENRRIEMPQLVFAGLERRPPRRELTMVILTCPIANRSSIHIPTTLPVAKPAA